MNDDARDAGSPLLPECDFADDIPRDAYGCLPVGALTAAKDCRISDGECFTMMNPENAFGTIKKEKTLMAKTPSPAAPHIAPVDAEPVDALVDESEEQDTSTPLPGPPRAPVLVQAHTEMPASSTAANELAGLVPKDGGSAITVMLALIAVAGGGAGWKFYQSFAKQKHEQRMKELEIKEKKIELQDDKTEHKACEAARAADRSALEQKIVALEARLAEAEKSKDAPASAPVELPFDPDELNDRIEQIERALKKAPSEKKPKAKKDAKKDA